MHGLSENAINELLRKCLNGEFKVEGWQHPLGFGHIKIHTNSSDKIRLHYWKNKMSEAELGEPDRIHNHAFDFTSHVLKGGLMERYFDIVVDSFGENTVWEIENLGDHSNLKKTTVKCTKKPSENIYHDVGSIYNMKAGFFHDTISTHENTVTLIFETPRPEVASLMVCSNSVKEIIRDKWPEISKDEIFKIINFVLEKYNDNKNI